MGLITVKPKRIIVFDTLRAVAIMMMLQGHFIKLTFEGFDTFKTLYYSNGTSGSILFDTWFRIKVYTAPFFFMISGVVFVYLLLLKKEETSYVRQRLLKGFKRGALLILIGYLLQVNLRAFLDTFSSTEPWIYAFHILQCIGAGIIALSGLFYLHLKIPQVQLWVFYLIAMFVFLFLYIELNNLTSSALYLSFPQLIQNAIEGPHSVFPIVPWLIFIFFGGFLGTLFKRYNKKIENLGFNIILMVFGLLFHYLCLRSTLAFLDVRILFIHLNPWGVYKFSWLFKCMGLFVFAIGFCNVLLKNKWIRQIPFSYLGKDTLTIYVVHCILLYGSVFGFGIKTFYKNSLSAFESIFYAGLFLVFFMLVIDFKQKGRFKKISKFEFKPTF